MGNILYKRLYRQKTRKDIKGLIPGKNKPLTEIQTPTRKMHFYGWGQCKKYP